MAHMNIYPRIERYAGINLCDIMMPMCLRCAQVSAVVKQNTVETEYMAPDARLVTHRSAHRQVRIAHILIFLTSLQDRPRNGG